MSKTIKIFLTGLLLAVCLPVAAQSRYGAIGGLTMSNTAKSGVHEIPLYHAGLTYQYKFPLGFAIQPSVMYQAKGSGSRKKVGENPLRISSVEIPVSLQWGPDLILFRPYVEVVPYMGFNVLHENTPMTTMAGGLGLGGGLEIWHFQIAARFNWDFAPASKLEGVGAFRCTTLSLAVLF